MYKEIITAVVGLGAVVTTYFVAKRKGERDMIFNIGASQGLKPEHMTTPVLDGARVQIHSEAARMLAVMRKEEALKNAEKSTKDSQTELQEELKKQATTPDLAGIVRGENNVIDLQEMLRLGAQAVAEEKAKAEKEAEEKAKKEEAEKAKKEKEKDEKKKAKAAKKAAATG